MKTPQPKKPATHKIDFLLYRKTERGIFRLNIAGEWVRSTIDPDDFHRQAKKLTATEINMQPTTQKSQRDSGSRSPQRLQRIEEVKNAIQKEINKTGEIPSRLKTTKLMNCGKPMYHKALIMLKQNTTAEEAVIIYEQNNQAA